MIRFSFPIVICGVNNGSFAWPKTLRKFIDEKKGYYLQRANKVHTVKSNIRSYICFDATFNAFVKMDSCLYACFVHLNKAFKSLLLNTPVGCSQWSFKWWKFLASCADGSVLFANGQWYNWSAIVAEQPSQLLEDQWKLNMSFLGKQKLFRNTVMSF